MKRICLACIILLCLGACVSTPVAPGRAPVVAAGCHAVNEAQVAALFDRWNDSLQTADAHRVAANYAKRSILLPTMSNKPRLTDAERVEYFEHFLENRPSGKIDLRQIDIGCDSAVDAGLYTFTFARTGAVVHARYTFTYAWLDGQWLITSHHSSAMPEKQ